MGLRPTNKNEDGVGRPREIGSLDRVFNRAAGRSPQDQERSRSRRTPFCACSSGAVGRSPQDQSYPPVFCSTWPPN